MGNSSQSLRIDPDPVTIVATCVGAVAAVLQLVQIAIEVRKIRSEKFTGGGKNFLPQIDGTARDLLENLRRIQRSIDYGSADPESEFYDASFRVGVSLKLDAQQFQQFNMALPFFHSGNLAHTINAMVQVDPTFAASIGEALEQRIPNTKERVNAAIADGKNRDLLLEAKATLQALVDEIEARDRRGNEGR